MKWDKAIAVLNILTHDWYKVTAAIKILENVYEASYSFDTDTITLGDKLLLQFRESKLPCYCLFYHELFHVLFTRPNANMLEQWRSHTNYNPQFSSKYLHLNNWIEDLYIEDKGMETYPYLQDLVMCLRGLPVDNLTDITKAFNYYYVTRKATPALSDADGKSFISYIELLLKIRKDARFGTNVLSRFVHTLSVEHTYIVKLIEFYNWCVSKGIFPKDIPLPNAPHPVVTVNIIDPNKSKSLMRKDNSSNATSIDVNGASAHGNGNSKSLNSVSPMGSYSAYTDTIGGTNRLVVYDVPKHNDKLILEKFTAERGLFTFDIGESNLSSLDGLFNNRWIPTKNINKPIIQNFFNPIKIIEEDLFLKKDRVFTNVSIYRDISGSTSGRIHGIMDSMCKELVSKIPIECEFYLYASGDISIVKCDYVPWEDSSDMPQEYEDNPDIQHLGGGTNSGAIANVITQQFNDKWLNIIITDGDLYSLYNRENINKLLENCFIIFICDYDVSLYTKSIDANAYIQINDVGDIPRVINKLAEFGRS